MRAYNGKVFKQKEHHERLIKSGELIDVSVPYSIEELTKATSDVLRESDLTDAYIRPIVWRGDENLGVKSYLNSVNVAIFAWKWGTYFGDDKIKSGINLSATKFVRPDPRKGYEDVLMLDWRGFVAECTSCNIFFIKNNEIHTPISDCFLNGITRQTIMELAKKMGYKVIERHILSQEIANFDEAFVTGTAVEVMPINSIFDTIVMK
ncbi:unnamed protein product, partial [Rotaria magnacalcarata]